MDSPIRKPREGLSTLFAQFTRESVDHILQAIRKLRVQGMSEKEILQKLDDELPEYDLHTRRRLYDKSQDAPVVDDIKAEEVLARREVKADELELTLKSTPSFAHRDTLIRFQNDDWVVVKTWAQAILIKRLPGHPPRPTSATPTPRLSPPG